MAPALQSRQEMPCAKETWNRDVGIKNRVIIVVYCFHASCSAATYTACPLPATPRLPDNHSPLDTLIQGLELRPSSHSPLNPSQLLRQF